MLPGDQLVAQDILNQAFYEVSAYDEKKNNEYKKMYKKGAIYAGIVIGASFVYGLAVNDFSSSVLFGLGVGTGVVVGRAESIMKKGAKISNYVGQCSRAFEIAARNACLNKRLEDGSNIQAFSEMLKDKILTKKGRQSIRDSGLTFVT